MPPCDCELHRAIKTRVEPPFECGGRYAVNRWKCHEHDQVNQNSELSAVVSAIIARLIVWRVSASAGRSAVATLHLIRTTISTCTTRNTTSTMRHRRIALRSHARPTLPAITLVATASRAWCSHRRLLAGIPRHWTSRVRSSLRGHALRTAVLRETIGRRGLSVRWSLRLLG